MKKFTKSKRKFFKRGVKKTYRSTNRKYNDIYNYVLQHNECQTENFPTVDGYKPTSFGSGMITGNELYNGDGTWDFQGAFLFRLRDLLQWNQLKTLYDRVKLNGVKITIIPQQNVADVSLSQLPVIKFVHDYDDANIAYNSDQIWARQGKIRRLNKPFSLYVKPRAKNYVVNLPQNGAISPIPAGSIKMGFMDTALSADIPFYALKFAVRDWTCPTDTLNKLKFKVEIKYYVTFRNQILNTQIPKNLTTETGEQVAEEETPPEAIPT